ncbi:MAG TPA: histidine kinase dimerization/phosphoacceptor domain-containing protein, partial [Myxococcota bacterium]|nr:histidine kinase dimerization/phosphoacceptor domain-containing protein [Myxococcota bacterium]
MAVTSRMPAASPTDAALYEASPDLVIVARRDGTFTRFFGNRSGIPTPVPLDQLVERSMPTILPPHVATLLTGAIERACDTGEVVRVEYQIDLHGLHDIEARASRITADTALVLVRDFTPRRSPDDLRQRVVEPIIRAQEQERRRLARELHDTLAQSITSLLVGLRSLEAHVQPDGVPLLESLRQLAGSTLGEAQRLARGL